MKNLSHRRQGSALDAFVSSPWPSARHLVLAASLVVLAPGRGVHATAAPVPLVTGEPSIVAPLAVAGVGLSGRALPTVVALDPGHGGTNLGASGSGRGVFEKKVTLALADRIRVLLGESQGPEISVVLCRESDVMVPIRARARCAQDSGARLFISLHTNAVPAGVRPGSQHGFEVFVLGPREVEDDATLAALGSDDDAAAVWAAHEVRAAAEKSILLGRVINDALTQALGPAARRGIKQAGAALDVLRGTGTASALVEVGFLDHPEEGMRLASVEGREPIARALVAAIRSFVQRDEDREGLTRASSPPTAP